MRFTNQHGLPEAMFRALSKNRYSGADVEHDYSATTLLKPPQIVMLERRHADEIEEDVIDRLWSMFGSIGHTLLEEHCPENEMGEVRLFAEIHGRKISGQFDGYHPLTKALHDYKVTSAWTLVYESRTGEWAEQLNILAYLLRENGHPVESASIVAILRDWSRSKALSGGDYPQAPIQIIPVELWAPSEQEKFLSERVSLMIANEGLNDECLCPCTPEEMWEKPTKYALMKEGRKSAVKLYDDFTEAGDACAAAGKGHSVVTRPGERTRCQDYCPVADFCHQFKAYKATLTAEEG